ncbi:MAG TPA: hypothetical protein VJU86_21205 [Pyrinomonadaceae bacterium]|nr:hypothetical protein [Pyrinomonadaceae bacterium]
MSKSATTVRDVFELPEPGADGSENWQAFQKRVKEEAKGIKTAALPDMAAKVAELFEIPIPDIFLASWKKANGIQTLLEESRNAPETVMNAELGEHTINSQHKPHIEVRIQNKSVKKIEFTLKLVFNLKGFILKIQNGAIREVQTGSCEVRGKMEYQGLVIADKKLAPIALPGLISFDKSKSEQSPQPVPEKPADAKEKAKIVTTAEKQPLAASAGKPGLAPRIHENSSMKTGAQVEGIPVETPAVVKVNEPETSSSFAGLRELAAPEIVQSKAAVPNESAKTVAEDIGVVEQPKHVSVAKPHEAPAEPEAAIEHQTPEPSEEAEERMTWEVGDVEDEGIAAAPVEGQASVSESDSAPAKTDENPEDVISRMSRELADKQQGSNAG